MRKRDTGGYKLHNVQMKNVRKNLGLRESLRLPLLLDFGAELAFLLLTSDDPEPVDNGRYRSGCKLKIFCHPSMLEQEDRLLYVTLVTHSSPVSLPTEHMLDVNLRIEISTEDTRSSQKSGEDEA